MTEEDKQNIRGVLQSVKEGIPLNKLENDYTVLTGSGIPYRQRGFKNLETFLKSIPDVVSLSRQGHEVIVKAVADEATQHLASLLARQRSNRNSSRSSGKTNRRGSYLSSHYTSNFRRPGNNQTVSNSGQQSHKKQPPAQSYKTSLNKPQNSNRTYHQYELAPRFKKATKMPVSSRVMSPPPASSPPTYIPPTPPPTRVSSPPREHFTPAATFHPPVKPQHKTSKDMLENFAKINKLGIPIFRTMEMTDGYFATVKLKNESYSSYPDGSPTPEEAEEAVAKKAIDSLVFQTETQKRKVCLDVDKMFERIKEILAEHPSGIIYNQVAKEYEALYNETLPSNWLEIATKKKILVVDIGASQCQILYPNSATNNNNIEIIDNSRLSGANSSTSEESDYWNISEMILPESNEWAVCVFHTTSTVDIRIRLVDYSDDFNDLGSKMDNAYGNRSRRNVEIITGELYAAKLDETWHRVAIIYTADKKALCNFVDIGENNFVSFADLEPLDDEFRKLPFQAIHVELNGLEEYANHPTALLHLDSLLGKTLMANVVSRTDDSISLILYDTSEEETVNLNEDLKASIEKEDITPKLPDSGISEGFLSYVTEEGVIYLQLHGKCYVLIEEMLQSLRKNCEDFPLLPKVSQDVMYLAKYPQNEEWYRGVIKQLDDENQLAVVFFLDYGNSDVVPYAHLRDLEPIDEKLVKLPPQAVKCTLRNIPPTGTNWTQTAIDRLYELAPPEQQLLVKIIPRLIGDQTKEVELFKRVDTGELVSINSTLGFDESLFRNSENSTKSDKIALLSKDIDERCNLLSPDLPDVGQCIDVHVAMAANPSNFMCQPWMTKYDFEMMTENMQNYYNKPINIRKIDSSTIQEGTLYACKHPDDNLWYRVQVKNIGNFEMSLYFVDFGDTIVKSYDALQPLPKQFRVLPYQAFYCKLADVLPFNSIDWLAETCIRFQSLVMHKEFVAKILTLPEDNTGIPSIGVTLIDTGNEQFDVSISKILVEEQHARYLDSSN